MTQDVPGDYSIKARALWGIAPVAPIHFGLDPLLVALRGTEGQRVIALADSHVTLQRRAPPREAAARTAYYRCYLLNCSGLSPSVVETSSYVTDPTYIEMLYRLLANVPSASARKAVPSAAKNKAVSEKLITQVSLVMQCADAFFLDASTVYGDSSQKRIYSLLDAVPTELLPAKPPQFVYAPAACDILGSNILNSTSPTRISIHDGIDEVNQKVARMYAPPPGQALQDGRVHALHEYFRWSVFPWQNYATSFRAADGRSVQASTFEEYLKLYDSGKLHPSECKRALAKALNERIKSISSRMDRTTYSWIREPSLLDGTPRAMETQV